MERLDKVSVYFEGNRNDKARALMALKNDALLEMRRILEDMYEEDLFEILHELNDDFYRMEDLDSVYSTLTATEVLEELTWVDIHDDYFNSNREISGNDMWEVSGYDIEEQAESLLSGELDYNHDEIDDLISEYNDKVITLKARYAYYENAKQLFEVAMKENPDEVIALLWNMNN
jgi:hypothetical protein